MVNFIHFQYKVVLFHQHLITIEESIIQYITV